MCELEAFRVFNFTVHANNGAADRLTEEAERIKENDNVKIVLKSLSTILDLLLVTPHSLAIMSHGDVQKNFCL